MLSTIGDIIVEHRLNFQTLPISSDDLICAVNIEVVRAFKTLEDTSSEDRFTET